MIEQHYYTRERGGLFSKTDGYDTIAKSPGLKLEFIKKYLHPICSYDSPNTLQKSGEEDETKYPPNLMIMPVATGELIIGQAVYKSKDFTGLRSTFFMHNYVLSANEKHRYVKEPEKLFGITKFDTDYDITLGTEIPTLAAIPYEGHSLLFRDRASLLSALQMDEALFEKLLAAIFTAINSKKKIFIVLDVPISELGIYAKALLYHVYSSLPWSVTEELGVSTYSRSSEGKKNIHITFLEKDVIRYDGKVNKEFVLDFVNQKFLNLDETTHLEPYFRVAAEFRTIKPLWEKFNSYGQQLLNAMKDKGEKTLNFYNRVATLFNLYAHLATHKLYILQEGKERKGFLTDALTYLSLTISDELKREFIGLIDYAINGLEVALRSGILLSQDEISALIKFELGINQGSSASLDHLLTLLLETIEVARIGKNETYIKETLDKVSKETVVYEKLFEKLYTWEGMREEVAYTYIKDAFEGVQTVDAFISKMKRFKPVETILHRDVYYSNVVKTKFMNCLQTASNKVRLLKQVQDWCSKQEGRLYEELVILAEEHFLKHVRLESIESEPVLCSISFKYTYDDDTYEAIKDYQRLKTNLEAMSPKHIKVNPIVQKQIKNFYTQSVKKEDFYMLVYAFLEPKGDAYTGEYWRLNLAKVLQYLYPISPELMLEFIVWSKGQEVYMNKAHFDATVINFFMRLKQTEGKWPKELAKQKLEGQLKTRALYMKLSKAMQPAFIKILSQYGKTIAIGLGVICLCVGMGIGGYLAYDHYLVKPTIKVDGEMMQPNVKLPISLPILSKEEIEEQMQMIKENNEDKESQENKEEQNQDKTDQDKANSEKINENKADEDKVNQEEVKENKADEDKTNEEKTNANKGNEEKANNELSLNTTSNKRQ